MKIEIGESLALSYLKHVKKCTIYQTNWKISSQWTKLNEKAVKEAFNKINEYDAFKNVFPNKNLAIEVRLEQILKQAEIDILGMNQEEKKIYAMDVAFHKDGLRYSSSSEETKENLIKKSLSSYLMLLRYFPDKDYEITFASPKVIDSTEKLIVPAFEELKTFFNKNIVLKNKVEFKYISNDAFSKEILKETIDNSKEDSDTNELFMRSYKLIQLLEDISNKKNKKINLNKKNSPTDYIELEFEQKNLEFEFIPSDEKQFKKELIKTKQAKITWFYPDRQEETIWNADKITENSKIRENIRNRKKVKAREKSGLYKVKLEII